MKIVKTTTNQLILAHPTTFSWLVVRPLIITGIVSGLIAGLLYIISSSAIASGKISDLLCRRLEKKLVNCELTVKDRFQVVTQNQIITDVNIADVYSETKRNDEDETTYICRTILLTKKTGYQLSSGYRIPLAQFSYTSSSDRNCKVAHNTKNQINRFIGQSTQNQILFYEDTRPDIRHLNQLSQNLLLIAVGILTIILVFPSWLRAQTMIWVFDHNKQKFIIKSQKIHQTLSTEYDLDQLDDIIVSHIPSESTDGDGDKWYHQDFKLDFILNTGEVIEAIGDRVSILKDFKSFNLESDKVKEKYQQMQHHIKQFLGLTT